MIPNTSFNVASVQVSQLPIQVTQIEGYFKGAANAWLQVFDSCVAPSVAAVPLLELPLNAGAAFQETLQVARMVFAEGVFIAVSDTEGTYTQSASTMDITVWTDTAVIVTNVVGDKTSAVTSLQVWDEATGAASNKKLYGLVIQVGVAQASTIALAYAQIPPTDYTIFQSIMQPKVGYNRLYFGRQGLRPFSNTLPNTQHQGCKLFLSNTMPIANGSNIVAPANCTILAITN